MNYGKIYYNIIGNRRNNPLNGYTERHHIIPKSLGGNDHQDNIVNLSAKEHFVCHLLLTKMYGKQTPEYHKMIKAFMMMLWCHSDCQKRYVTSKSYENLKKQFSINQSINQTGQGNSQFGRKKTDVIKNKIRQTLLVRNRESREIKLEQKKQRQTRKEQKKLKDIDNYREYYKIYCKVGWDEFVKITGYKYSKPNLVSRFSNLLPEFIPQNGKKRV